MSIKNTYRRVPNYLAVPLAVLGSAVVAVALAALGVFALDFLLDKFHRGDDLDHAILGVFYAAPSIAVLGFVSCFSILIRWRHATSWRAPTFAFALGSFLLWLWAHDWIGFAWYVPGAIAWLASCWFLRRKVSAHSGHVLQA